MKTLNKYIGDFLPRTISDPANLGGMIDGSNCKKLLKNYGYKVVENKDAGSYGYAKTECGLILSTNGFLSE